MSFKFSERQALFSAVLSGLMLTASFPPGDMGWMAWFALVPLLVALDKTSPSKAFRLGLVAGMAHYLTLVYWVIVAMSHYGGLNFLVSGSVMVLLCLYLSLYPALFSYFYVFLKESRLVALQAACVWVLLEYIRGRFLTGFPWSLLGYSQYDFVELIQITDLVGVYGVSFLIVAMNGFIQGMAFKESRLLKATLRRDFPLLLSMVLSVLLYGHYRLSQEPPFRQRSPSLKVAVVQGNIDQSVKWDHNYQKKTMDIYTRLSLSAASFRPDLVVWPETSLPFFFQENNDLSKVVFEISKILDSDIIFGSPAYEREGNEVRYYNRVYYLPRGGNISFYDKVHLVPFGEYVPMKRFLPFVNRLVPAAGDFTPGRRIEPLKADLVSPGILICFEAIFPEIAREHVANGADILVNLTNDAWFGRTSAPFQHLSMAVFRAVENDRPL
ncbi:MAG: apolipoprotein N-acyltransferase, partial [Deltaproteobacteria bacterium]|nr:apolipoprotein N-acyltransferase [Deltaproteobacteria bacterium]